MNDREVGLRLEVQELKAEVRRLRRSIEGAYAVIGLIVVSVCPGLLVLVAVGAIGYLAFLFTPSGRKIFSSLIHPEV